MSPPDRLPDVSTVFVGGGTPSLLGAAGLTAVLDAVREHFTLAPDAEVTTEANPESTSPQLFGQLRSAGFTRVSLGMQSVAPHVLAVLDRVHSPGRALDAAREARAAGFDHVNLDLIYGTPGESDDDLRRSVDAAIDAGVDHVSGYALVVEDGTALARRVRRGEIAAPDDDVLAARYELLDARLSAAGFDWYEVSNWCRPGGECRHNIGYWNGGEWWGAGPGAHGYLGATRWWNVKHPNAYAQSLADGLLPVADFERLDAATRHVEDVMLRLRLRDGLPVAVLSEPRTSPRRDGDRRRPGGAGRKPAGAHRPRPATGRRGGSRAARLTPPRLTLRRDPPARPAQAATVTSTARYSPMARAAGQSPAATARARSSDSELRAPNSASQADTVGAISSPGTWTARSACRRSLTR